MGDRFANAWVANFAGVRRIATMFFAFIFIGIIMMLVCYRLKKLRLRRRGEVSTMIGVLGSDTSTVVFGCLVIGTVIAIILSARPGVETQHKIKQDREIAARQILGQYLGKKLATRAKKGGPVLLIDRVAGEQDQALHDAARSGLEASLGSELPLEKVELVDFRSTKKDERSQTEALRISKTQFDEIIRRHPECRYVVSLVGLPSDFDQSSSSIKVRNKKLTLAVYTDDVYLKGDFIANGTISACVVPYPNSTLPDINPEASLEDQFAARYIYIESSNILKVVKEHRRLFRLTRRPG
ncbi:MAG: hypothetical protein ACI8W8_003049 [Rhodothermales bacterium]